MKYIKFFNYLRSLYFYIENERKKFYKQFEEDTNFTEDDLSFLEVDEETAMSIANTLEENELLQEEITYDNQEEIDDFATIDANTELINELFFYNEEIRTLNFQTWILKFVNAYSKSMNNTELSDTIESLLNNDEENYITFINNNDDFKSVVSAAIIKIITDKDCAQITSNYFEDKLTALEIDINKNSDNCEYSFEFVRILNEMYIINSQIGYTYQENIKKITNYIYNDMVEKDFPSISYHSKEEYINGLNIIKQKLKYDAYIYLLYKKNLIGLNQDEIFTLYILENNLEKIDSKSNINIEQYYIIVQSHIELNYNMSTLKKNLEVNTIVDEYVRKFKNPFLMSDFYK